VTVDTIPPVLTLLSPTNGGFVTTARPSISVSATDALSGVNFATATLTLDTQQVATGTLSYTPPANLSDGLHSLTASVADRAGNVATLSASFTIDTQPPSAAQITGITDGQIIKGTIPITLSATDTGSGVATMDLLVDGNFFTRLVSPFQANFNTTFIPDGNHVLSATATDAAGNVGPPGTLVHVIVDNVPLSVSFTSPAAGTPFNSQVTVTAVTNKATQHVDFALGSQHVSVTTSPFTATFSVAALTEGSQTVTATAFDFAGNSATANLLIIVDRTPPAAPNSNLINAEPPLGGFSQVHGLVGSVEAFATLQITNTVNGAQATASVAGDGTFSTNIAGKIDDTLSLVAVDAAGNRSAASLITVRRTSSLPPATGSTSLNFAGAITDRVGTAAGALSPDGALDAVFTVSLNIGAGVTRTLSRIDLSNGSTTHSAAAGVVPVGVSTDVTSPFLNNADGSISSTVTSGATLTLITSDNGFIHEGLTYTVTASFTDGSRFVGTFFLVPADDHQLVAHSATITANPPMVTSSAGAAGISTITVGNIRDINGTLVPDGTNIALSVANQASANGLGDLIPSAGGSITDGSPAANNPNFKVFTIQGGSVTATYSGQPVSPPPVFGSVAVVQMLPADSAGNIIGTEVEATQDINVRATTDLAIVGATPASLYADRGDHRSHVVVQVRNAQGNPVPDGTQIAVSAAPSAAFFGCCFIGSAGGSIIGGRSAPSDSRYSLFNTSGGSIQFDYSDSGVSTGTDGTRVATIVVASVNSNGSINQQAIGTGTITLVGPADAEMGSSMTSVPLDSIIIPVSISIRDVHDARGNLVPDGTAIAVSAASSATFAGCCFIGSAGGSIIDGIVSPSDSRFHYFTLASNAAAATYTVDGVAALSPGSTAIANIQLAPADPSGSVLDQRALKVLPIILVPPLNAVANSQPSMIFGDGGIHTATVTFKPILDTFGNPVPEGSKMAVSAASSATFAGCCFIGSAGGQVLSGTVSPSDSRFMVHTVQNGGIVVSYADQNVIASPGQILTANVQLAEARADGTIPSGQNIGLAGIRISGLTSATVTASPNLVFSDGGDHRTTVTVTNLRDALGNLVPDGTLIAASASSSATFAGCCFIGSAGGSIIGGTTASSDGRFQIFPVQNGQVVFQYSPQGIVVAQGQRTANVQIAAVNASGGIISGQNIGVASIQLLAPGSASISVSPSDIFSDGVAHFANITISNLKASDGVTPVPDGSRLGLSVVNSASFIGCCFIGSAGGQILSAGTTAGDGTVATGNGNFELFTVAGGQILATYSDIGIVTGVGQTQTANVQVVPAATDGSIPTGAALTAAPILLHGISSTTANGPVTLSKAGGSATITFSGIKDSAGHLVPDGTIVVVTAANSATFSGCCFNGSTGGTILDGGASPSGSQWKVFTVQHGIVTVTYSPSTAGVGTARIQMTGARPDGSVLSGATLDGGVWAINITN